MLNQRLEADCRWRETMAALAPWITAEINRDRKRRRKPFAIRDFVLSEIAKTPQRARAGDQDALRSKIDRMLGGAGRQRGSDNR